MPDRAWYGMSNNGTKLEQVDRSKIVPKRLAEMVSVVW